MDLNSIWMPYAQMKTVRPSYKVISAQDFTLTLADGRQVLDGVSSWWAVIHGYNQLEINEAMIDQLGRFSHVMLGGLIHDPVLDCTERLLQLTPAPLQHVFYADSGSVGCEVALKMAIQFWMNQGKRQKKSFLAFKKAYHGDTIGVMSVGDPDDGMHAIFQGVLLPQFFLDAPPAGFDLSADQLVSYFRDLDLFFEQHADDLAGVIIEPILQAAGGFNIYSPLVLVHLRSLCDHYDVLMICDEVATGFGRTGRLFACEHANICPDIMVLGKALTGGYMGMSATLATSRVFEAFYSDDAAQALMHGPTFMGNPLACRAAIASMDLFIQRNCLDQVQLMASFFEEKLKGLQDKKGVQVRVLGALAVLEYEYEIDVERIQAFGIENGVWLRPFGRFVYVMPGYGLTEGELATLCNVFISLPSDV